MTHVFRPYPQTSHFIPVGQPFIRYTALHDIKFNTGIGRSDLETKVCSESTQLDISYATLYELHLPRYGRYGRYGNW